MRGYAQRPEIKVRNQARRRLRHEIAMGRLQRGPCEVCGDTCSQAHHDDYAKPIEVRWLCKRHHVAHHAAAEGE